MDCPDCRVPVAPMSGSSWAIAWYSCPRCTTFWYARLRVGRDAPLAFHALPAAGATQRSGGSSPDWTLEELEAEAAALRRESDCLPKGDPDALRRHLEKLKVLADAINRRLEASSGTVH